MQEQINLTIPRGWNQCTPNQLEQIALIMQEQIAKADRYHPFDMKDSKGGKLQRVLFLEGLYLCLDFIHQLIEIFGKMV